MSFFWTGLDEFRREMAAMPSHLVAGAAPVARAAADSAATTARAKYPHVSGRLASALTVSQVTAPSPYGVNVKIENTAPYAAVYDVGSAPRTTRRGYNRGRMPAGQTFVPAAQLARAGMYEHLKDVLRAEGFEVTGDAR